MTFLPVSRFVWTGLLVALATVSSSCANLIALQGRELRGDGSWQGTAVLMNYSIESGSGELPEECTLRIRNTTLNQEYSIGLPTRKSQASMVLFDAPPGTYVGSRLECDYRRRFEVERIFRDGLSLTSDRINYAGKIRFVLKDQGQNLTLVSGDRKEDNESLKESLQQLPAEWRGAVVSGYTRKPITAAMLGSDQNYRLSYRIGHEKEGDPKAAEPLIQDLLRCEEEEVGRSPVRIGTIAFEAKWAGGKLEKLERETNRHSFSDAFVRCMESAFRAFAPRGDQKLEFRVTY